MTECSRCSSKEHSFENCPFDRTYVQNDVEVKLTGRTAQKSTPGVGRNKEPKVTTLYEISPADPEAGSWKKWVRITELFEIKK